MELRCLRKGSVSYGLGADLSLPHCLVGDKVSESIAEPSPAGISERRAEISWCIVMVQRSGTVSRGTAVGCFFFNKKSQQTRYLEMFQPVNRVMYSVPSQLYSSLQSGFLVARPHQVLLIRNKKWEGFLTHH